MTPTPTDPNTLVTGTPALAADVEAKVDVIFAYLQGNVDADAIAAGAIGATELAALAVTHPKVAPWPGARATNSPSVAAPATARALTFAAEDWDTDNMFTLSSPKRLTVVTPGVYALEGHFAVANPATGFTAVIRRNGTDGSTAGLLTAATGCQSGATGEIHASASTHVRLAAADYIELAIYHGGVTTVQQAFLSAAWLAP
jgi:hypothetical protein